MVNSRPPMPPPPPPGQVYNATNGARNGYGNNNGSAAASFQQAQSSMANMNLHTNASSSASGVGVQSMQQMMPPPPAMPPPPGRAISSTPGRAAPYFSQQQQQASAPTPQQFPHPQTPSAPRSVPGHATSSRGSMMPPPPANQYQQQHPNIQHASQSSAMHPPPPMPPPPANQFQRQPMPPPPYNQAMQQSNAMPPPPSPYSHNGMQNNMQQQPQIQQHVPPMHPTNANPPAMQQLNSVPQPPGPPPMPPQMSQQQSYPRPPPPGPPTQHYPAPQQQQQHSQYPPQPPGQQQMQQQQQHSQYPHHPPQHHPSQQMQQQHPPHHNPNRPHQERDKIDPSQIPRIPLFTRPHHAPATIYPSHSNASTNMGSITGNAASQSLATISGPPPPCDSRYVCSAEYENVNPRIMRCSVHSFPLDNATSRKCDLPLGLVVSPLAGLSELCGGDGDDSAENASQNENAARINDATGHSASYVNGREQGEIYGDSTANANSLKELDYIPSTSTNTPPTTNADDPERIPVIRGTKKQLDKNSEQTTRAISPPRCNRCQAYLNPFSTPISSTSHFTMGYVPDQYYNCNFCGASSSISIPEDCIANGTFDAATRFGTVEYEVGGPYCVRKEGPVQNVHLYGVEYVPPTKEMESDHHHHGSVRSHGWLESLEAIREVGRGLALSAPKVEDESGRIVNAPVKIGLFAFCQDMLVFPYLKRRKACTADANGNRKVMDVDHHQYDAQYDDDWEGAELKVSIVNDVTNDPFCPLPLHLWTYDVGAGLDSYEWKRFNRILDEFTAVMEQLIESESRPCPFPPDVHCVDSEIDGWNLGDGWSRNCGGSALAALADALHDSGGKATLITTRRPNFGVGSLPDREKRAGRGHAAKAAQSPYKRPADEQRLYTPLQRLKRVPDDESTWSDGLPAHFYRELGELCARQRICIDIVVTSSKVNVPPGASNTNVGLQAVHPNPREFVDVATLGELCRVTCGKFKWLRVGNECGVAVDTAQDGETFTSEQLREELKRSALAYMGTDAVFKLRCSHGVQVKQYCPTLPVGTLIGDGIVNSAELELSNIHSGTSIAVLLEHKVGGVQETRGGRKGIDAPMVFFQSAVLYTTLTGRRRVRVSTMGLVTTKVPADIYRSADLGTVATIMTRQAISDLEDPNEGSLHNARSNVFAKCVSILANYRMHTSARSSPAGQLILPESLQLLPLFCLSLRKSRLFRNSSIPFKGPFPTADERAYHIFYGRMVSPYMSLQCVHPNLLNVTDMRTRDGEWITPPVLETNKYAGEKVIAASMRPVCQLPKSMNPSIACLDEKGMYILDDRFAFYLFIGKDVPEEKWKELLSVSSQPGVNRVGGEWVSNVPMGQLTLASTESGHKLRNILHQLRALNSPNPTLAMNARHTYAPLVLVFVGRGSVFEQEMDSLLVDDPDGHEKSYVDFLCDVHRAVRQKSEDQ